MLVAPDGKYSCSPAGPFERQAGDDGEQRERYDGKVDAARYDHHRHAKRDNGDEGEIARHIEEVLRRGKGGGQDAEREAGEHGREEHPECRPAYDPAVETVRFAFDTVVEARMHG